MDYDTRKVKRIERPNLWRHAVSDTFFPLEIDFADEDLFDGTLATWSLGSIAISRMRCGGIHYQRHKHHFLDETESSLLITVPEVEDVHFRQNNRETACSPGGFLIERGDAPYQFWHGKPNSLWVVKVPTLSVRSRIGPTDRLGALCFDATNGVASYFLDTVKTTISHIDTINDLARHAAGQHILEMLCLSIRNDDRVLDSNTSSVRAAHLYRAEQFIRDNLETGGLSPQMVADACGISLRYLQRLFSESDQSINNFIREKRLNRCREDLQSKSNNWTIAEIAYRWGFTDQSQLCKHYRAAFGETPSETRKRAFQGSDDGAAWVN